MEKKSTKIWAMSSSWMTSMIKSQLSAKIWCSVMHQNQKLSLRMKKMIFKKSLIQLMKPRII